MKTQIKYLPVLLVVMLGVFLSTSTTAQAQLQQPTFTINPDPGYVNEPIIATRTSSSGPGAVYEWDCNYIVSQGFDAEEVGDEVQCQYGSSGSYGIALRASSGSDSIINWDSVSVRPQSEKPFDTILAGPSTITVPQTAVAFKTPKPVFYAACSVGQLPCPITVTGPSGPDGDGLYTHYVRVENARPGPIRLETWAETEDALADADYKAFTIQVAGAPAFRQLSADLRVCESFEKKNGQVSNKQLQLGGRVSYYHGSGPNPTAVKVVLKRSYQSPDLKKAKKRRWEVVQSQVFRAVVQPYFLEQELEGLLVLGRKPYEQPGARYLMKVRVNTPAGKQTKKTKLWKVC